MEPKYPANLKEIITKKKAVPIDKAISFNEISERFQKFSAKVSLSLIFLLLYTATTCGLLNLFLKKLSEGISIRITKYKAIIKLSATTVADTISPGASNFAAIAAKLTPPPTYEPLIMPPI